MVKPLERKIEPCQFKDTCEFTEVTERINGKGACQGNQGDYKTYCVNYAAKLEKKE